MSRKLRVFAWLAVIGLFAAPVLAQTQATTGEVQGRVMDSAGGVLSGATVTVSDPSRAISRVVVTDSDGAYTALLLPPGTYQVSAEATGFQTTVYKNIQVTVGSSVTLNLSLKVGGLEESLTVEGTGAAVETTSTVTTATVNMKAMDNLPINGRRFQDFVNLTPTAQTDTSRGQISLAGQRGINANVAIDGADYNQPFFGGIRGGERSNFAFTVPQESIQEFQVVATGYSAEFGRSTGGIVNAVTKSGTNNFHGSAFYLNRNSDIASKNVFGQTAVQDQNQFGGSFGGPLMKDKLFFFVAYEQQDINDPRAVLFSNLVGFTPLATSREAYDYYISLQTPFEATNNAKALLGRIDYQFNPSNRLSLRYSHSSNEALNATSTGNTLNPTITDSLAWNGTEQDGINAIIGQYSSVLKPSLLLDARAQYSKETRPRVNNGADVTNVQNAIGRYGTVNFLPTTQFDWRAQAAVNLTWLKGKHMVKMGTEYNHVYVDQTFGFNQFGSFTTFPSTNTANILELMSVGGAIPNRFDATGVQYLHQVGNLLLDFATDELAFYAQDNWRVRQNLTINVGLRWEGGWNPTPEANNEILLAQVRGVTFPSGEQVDPTQIPDQLSQFAPRAGFSWDPKNDGKTVIRGYGGMYYARTPALVYASPMNNWRVPPGDLSVTLPFAVPAGNPNNTLYKQFLLAGINLNNFPLGQLPNLTNAQIQSIAQALGVTFNPYLGVAPLATDTGYKNPRSYQVGLGGEREVLSGLTLGLEGVVVKTTNLERNFDVNQPLPVIRATDAAQRPFYGLTTGTPRPVNGLASIQLRQSSARSLYQALVVSARLQKKWGQFNVYYTLSNSKSDDDNERDSGGVLYQDTYNLAPEYGPARLDRRNAATGSLLFFLPAGFNFGTSFTLLSGLPVNATQGADLNGDRVNTDRPYHSPGVPFTRNEFRNQSLYNVNFRVQWTWKIKGTNQVTVAADFFNAFNFSNIQYAGTAVTNYCAVTADTTCGFGAPTNPNFLQVRDQNPLSTNYGNYLLNNTPNALWGPRQIQLGIRYQF